MKLYTTVRYGQIRRRGLFALETREDVEPGDVCLVRTARGEELGTVLARPALREGEGRPGCGSGACGSCAQVQGRVLRLARPDETERHREDARRGTREEIVYARDRVRERRLSVKIVDAEYLYQRQKLVLHYASESRVDLSEFTQELGRRFDTRIEWSQLGARDEARMVGDMASCGRELCCRSFLHDLRPVSMRMAKQQKKTLDPTKISGQCGKLKCCLRYEDEVYVELQKTMPKKGGWVEVDEGVGRILSVDFLLQKVVVEVQGERHLVHVSAILRTGLAPPKPGEPGGARPPRKVRPLVVPPRPDTFGSAPDREEMSEPEDAPEFESSRRDEEREEDGPRTPFGGVLHDDEAGEAEEPAPGRGADEDGRSEDESARFPRRRRRRGRRRGSREGGGEDSGARAERAPPPAAGGTTPSDGPSENRSANRRRRRRRKGGGNRSGGEGVSE